MKSQLSTKFGKTTIFLQSNPILKKHKTIFQIRKSVQSRVRILLFNREEAKSETKVYPKINLTKIFLQMRRFPECGTRHEKNEKWWLPFTSTFDQKWPNQTLHSTTNRETTFEQMCRLVASFEGPQFESSEWFIWTGCVENCIYYATE